MTSYSYCQPYSSYKRFPSHEVKIGDLSLGASFPVRIQTMTNTPTIDSKATASQIERLARAGAEMVRFTLPGKKEVESLPELKHLLKLKGCRVPLIADVHFNPEIAMMAAKQVDKVRINPGNFAEASIASSQIDFSDLEYKNELEKVHERLLPFIKVCKQNGTAVRIGSNHGSLSWRIVSRYGNTPAGMVEAAMEYLRIFKAENFTQAVVSMKASNVITTIHAARLLAQKMYEEKMSFPQHIGVTEAGMGNEGFIKSVLGSGVLLIEGIGDTMRISLTGNPETEIPVARTILEEISTITSKAKPCQENRLPFSPFSFYRRPSVSIDAVNPVNIPIVVSREKRTDSVPVPDMYIDGKFLNTNEKGNAGQTPITTINNFKEDDSNSAILIENIDNPYTSRNIIIDLINRKIDNPVLLDLLPFSSFAQNEKTRRILEAGPLLVDGLVDGLVLSDSTKDTCEFAFQLLQASRQRITRVEYISCPSCGRTRFDIASVVEKVKQATAHFKGIKIAIMGCVVNGPGEMADADFGYVGAGKGKVTLYQKQAAVLKNIPEEEAIEELLKLISNQLNQQTS